MVIGLLPTTALTLIAGSHWSTRAWLSTTLRPSRTEAYANGLRAMMGAVTHLSLCDVSDGHVLEGAKDGRALAPSGIELQCLVVSDAFEGVARIKRQQQIQSFFHCAWPHMRTTHGRVSCTLRSSLSRS
jgi:stress-induced morphogen